MIYPNFTWEAKFEDTLITKTNFSPFFRVETLEGDGLTKVINTYSPSGSIEDVENRQGNSSTFESNCEQNDYTVNCYQGGFSISDEEAEDDNTAIALMGGVANAFVNEFNEQAIGAMLTTEQEVEIDFTCEDEYYLYDKIMDMLEYLGEDAGEAYVLVSFDNLAWVQRQLRGDLMGYNGKLARSGYVGSIAGVPIYVSKAMPVDNLAVGTAEGVSVFLKGEIETEKDYDPDARITYARYRKYGIVALTNGAKVVKSCEPELPYIDFDDPMLWYNITANRQVVNVDNITIEDGDYLLQEWQYKGGNTNTAVGYPLLPSAMTFPGASTKAVAYDYPYEYDVVSGSSLKLYPKYPISTGMSYVHLEKVEDGKYTVSKTDQCGNTVYLSADILGDNIWVKDVSYIDIFMGISNLDHTQWIKRVSDSGTVKFTCGNSGDHAALRLCKVATNPDEGCFDAHVQYGDLPYKYPTEFYITVNGEDPIYPTDKGYGDYKFNYTPQDGDVIQPYLKLDGFKLTPAPEIVYELPEIDFRGLATRRYDYLFRDGKEEKLGISMRDYSRINGMSVSYLYGDWDCDYPTMTLVMNGVEHEGVIDETATNLDIWRFTFPTYTRAIGDTGYYKFKHPLFKEWVSGTYVVKSATDLPIQITDVSQLNDSDSYVFGYALSASNGIILSYSILGDTKMYIYEDLKHSIPEAETHIWKIVASTTEVGKYCIYNSVTGQQLVLDEAGENILTAEPDGTEHPYTITFDPTDTEHAAIIGDGLYLNRSGNPAKLTNIQCVHNAKATYETELMGIGIFKISN